MRANQIAVSVQAQINSCTTNRYYDLFAKFAYVAGPDWTLVSGAEEGITQRSRANEDSLCVWNFPIDVVYTSPKPFGWPQLVIAVYGVNVLGNEAVVGYGAIHIPTRAGHHELNIPIFDRAPSLKERIKGFFSAEMPEVIQTATIAGGDAREIIKTESCGYARVAFDVVLSGLPKLSLQN